MQFLSSLRKFAVLGAAVWAGASFSTNASAAVVVWDVADTATPIGSGFNYSGLWLNFFTGSVVSRDDSANAPGWTFGEFQINANSAGYRNLANQTPYSNSGEWLTTVNGPARLFAGDLIDSTSSYTSQYTIFATDDGPSGYYNSFDDLGTGYLGVRFSDVDGFVYYGYIEITLDSSFGVTLNSFAYESVSGAPITAGAIPEPSSAAALAGGAMLSLVALRRRRRG